jgi:hypothetical protein
MCGRSAVQWRGSSVEVSWSAEQLASVLEKVGEVGRVR